MVNQKVWFGLLLIDGSDSSPPLPPLFLFPQSRRDLSRSRLRRFYEMSLGFNFLVFFLTTLRQKVKDQAPDMPVESLSAMIVAQQSV